MTPTPTVVAPRHSFIVERMTLLELAECYDTARRVVCLYWFSEPLRTPEQIEGEEQSIRLHTRLFRAEIRSELKSRQDAADTRKRLTFKFRNRVTETRGTPVEAFRAIRSFNSKVK